MYTFINMLGLAVGLSGFMLIMIYVYSEISYDKHHPDSKNTYRVAMNLEMAGNITKAAVSGGTLGLLMHEEIKEVAAYTRLLHYPRTVLMTSGDQKIYFEDIIYADSSFFDFFSYKAYLGEPAEALREPYSLVLTRSGANRLFGDDDPIGKSIKWNTTDNYIVRAVIEDPVQPTHIHFEALASFSTLENIAPYNRYINTLYAFVVLNYVKLYEGYGSEDVKPAIDSLVERHMGEGMKDSGATFDFYLQPIEDIYLHSHLRHELKANGDIKNLYIFSAIAVFILLIACINFITLTMARSIKRSVEVGIRKVFGAERRNLVFQFLSESIILALLSMLLAIILVEIMIPEIAHLSGSKLSLSLADAGNYFLLLFGITIVVGVLSGLYPAYIISAFSPLIVMRKRINAAYKTSWFRNVIIVLQFLITIFLLCGTIVIYLQLDFVKNKDTGISLENRIVIPLRGSGMISKYRDTKASFESLPGVEGVTASSSYPGKFEQRAGFYPEGSSRNDMWMLQNVQVDYNYLEVMDIKLLEGQNFSLNPEVDSLNVLVNEALVNEAGWENALGKYIGIPMSEDVDDVKLNVIGVVGDFNFASLHESVKPLVIMSDPSRMVNVTVKISPAGFSETLNEMELIWGNNFPGQPFNYFLLEDEFKRLYFADMKLFEVFTWFTFLAIFIACMGLFGLSSFMTAQRNKEIGIRKVMGSSSLKVLLLLIRSFASLILVAAIVAIPLSWYGMHVWLQNFANQTPLYWWIFPLGALLAIFAAVATVGFQSYKAANKNPVDAIRWE